MIGFRQHNHELRSLDDLTNGAHAEQTDVQRPKGNWDASQCRIVLVSQSLRLFQSPRLIQACKRSRLLRASTSAPSRSLAASRWPASPAANVAAGPPNS